MMMKKLLTALITCGLLTASISATAMTAGKYSVTVRGYNADVPVEVTVTEDQIADIAIGENIESMNIGAKAVEILPGRILEAQSIGVDSVSGATITSAAIKSAVRQALTQAGADLAAYSAVPEAVTEKKTVTLETDVIVVGTGIAGESAAVEAVNHGASVILLEKQDIIGGSTNASGGAIMGVDSPLNKDDIDDTKDWADFIYARDEAHENVDYNKILYVARVSGANVEWLMGMGYDPVLGYGGNSPVKWSHRPNDGTGKQLNHGGWKVINALNDAFTAAGGQLMTATPATALLTDESGAVIGVTAESKDTVYTIYAKGGVILACGGFDDNPELVARLAPKSAGIWNIGAASGDDGDGIIMAEAVGAKIISTGYLMPSWTTLHMAELNGLDAFGLKSIADAIYVNDKMNRYMNESSGMESQKWQMVIDGSDDFYMVLDSDKLDETMIAQLADCVSKKLAFTGSTIEEAAEAAGLDAAALAATVAHANEMAAKGADADFGNEKLASVDNGPFYIIPDTQGITGSYGGVLIDMEARVLDNEGKAIENLYAAGEITNGDFYYRDYICGGSSLAMGMAFGRVAGANAASAAK